MQRNSCIMGSTNPSIWEEVIGVFLNEENKRRVCVCVCVYTYAEIEKGRHRYRYSWMYFVCMMCIVYRDHVR